MANTQDAINVSAHSCLQWSFNGHQKVSALEYLNGITSLVMIIGAP